MKTKIGLVGLAVLSLGLAIGWVITKNQADEKQKSDASTILDFSNQWSQASIKVDELNQVNLTLNQDLATNRTLLADLSNHLAAVSETVVIVPRSPPPRIRSPRRPAAFRIWKRKTSCWMTGPPPSRIRPPP